MFVDNKMNRSNFLKVIEGDTAHYDLTSNVFFQLFKINKTPRRYMIEFGDLGRPDIISFKAYKSCDNWWIIMKANNIIDPYTELKVGDILTIPDIKDIQDYYFQAKQAIGKRNG
jgi:hypothetical protein